MIDFLLSVPGKLKVVGDNVATLLARWTQTIANNIDTTISSRAPSATALSTAIWTSLRAAALDTIGTVSGNVDLIKSKSQLGTPTVVSLPARVGSLEGALNQASFTSVITANSATPGTYTTVINETGRGVINFLAICLHSGASGSFTFRLTLDTTMLTFTGAFTSGGTMVGSGYAMVGAAGVNAATELCAVSLDRMPFDSAFKLEVTSSAGTGSFTTFHKYVRTA